MKPLYQHCMECEAAEGQEHKEGCSQLIKLRPEEIIPGRLMAIPKSKDDTSILLYINLVWTFALFIVFYFLIVHSFPHFPPVIRQPPQIKYETKYLHVYEIEGREFTTIDDKLYYLRELPTVNLEEGVKIETEK